MSQQYLLPMARNLITGQTVKTQDLTGARLQESQYVLAMDLARQLAVKMRDRTNEPWEGFVETYTPTYRRV